MLHYRKDIDGLRAISVMAVLLFHADLALFSGGFIGVDIFFVISGFLITSIIIKNMECGKFSLLNFYERRIRRIFPALFFMLLIVTGISSVLLLPPDLKDYGQSLATASVSLSNLLFWWETDYFSSDSTLKPLLHTWSLGVEEQFYIFFPVLIWLIYALKRQKNIFLIFSILFVLSLLASIWLTPSYPEFSFFLPFTRAWELLLGALIALNILPTIRNGTVNNMLSASGLLCILIPVFLFSKETVFPGVNALLPCLGGGLLIYSGMHRETFVHKLISIRPLVFTGLISYSLYLWHWPVFSLYRYFKYDDLIPAEIAIILAASFLMATLSWRYIERPFRGKKTLFSRTGIFIYAFLAVSAAIIIGAAFHIYKGLPQRLDPVVSSIIKVRIEKSTRRDICFLEGNRYNLPPEKPCIFGDLESGQYDIVLWGDSHADHLVPGLEIYAARNKFSGRKITKAGCAPLLGAVKVDYQKKEKHDCKRFNDNAIDFLLDNKAVKTVILAARWTLYTEGKGSKHSKDHAYLIDEESKALNKENSHRIFTASLNETVEKLVESGKKVILIGPVPESGYRVPDCLARTKSNLFATKTCRPPARKDVNAHTQFVHEVLLKLKDDYPQTNVFFPVEALCNGEDCAIEYEHKPLYKDEDHLSAKGSEYLLDQLKFKID